MNLPVFNDNLKSSASWIVALDRERESWNRSLSESQIRDAQIERIKRRAGRELDADNLRRAAEEISSFAGEADAKFEVDRLLDLHRTLIGAASGEDVLRKTEPLPISPLHDPTPAILLPRMLDNAFDWFSAPSFGELHPVEQAAVVFLRLLDLHPFPTHSEITAQLAAGYYTERAGLPPLIIACDEDASRRYANSLDAAFRMLTQPLVEFFAESLTNAMRIGRGA